MTDAMQREFPRLVAAHHFAAAAFYNVVSATPGRVDVTTDPTALALVEASRALDDYYARAAADARLVVVRDAFGRCRVASVDAAEPAEPHADAGELPGLGVTNGE